jgi:hypothetical protein
MVVVWWHCIKVYTAPEGAVYRFIRGIAYQRIPLATVVRVTVAIVAAAASEISAEESSNE